MTRRPSAPATLPPTSIQGLDPAWSRLVTTNDADGSTRTWHILDNMVESPSITVLCVHGNPTWSYLWRSLLAQAPDGVRVIAVDQLDMGFSERTGTTRRFRQRIDDLTTLTDSLDIAGQVVIVGQDWGGAIAAGWAIDNRERLAGMVLMNTAVNQPAGSPAPALIRAVRLPGVLDLVCRRTPTFVRGTTMLARPKLSKETRSGYYAPYLTAERRAAIAGFVEDIPLDEKHPSHRALSDVASGLSALASTPALLVWGPSDPVFSDRYLRDLSARLPHASVHRFEGAGHLTPEDADVAGAVFGWLDSLDHTASEKAADVPRRPLWAAIEDHATDPSTAVIEMNDGARSLSFVELDADVRRVAAGLTSSGVQPGDRVAVLIPPGIDLTVCVYACWRIGAVVIGVDASLGARGIGRALRSSSPDYLIGVARALRAAALFRWPGVRISAGPVSPALARSLSVTTSLDDLRRTGDGVAPPEAAGPEEPAAIAFTSGATGPSKGVAYRHRQLQAQRDALIDLYQIGPDDRLVAAFAPFALFGPSMGIPSVVPAMDVTAPGTLTARALADAAAAIDATLVFASPAALRNVAATAADLTGEQRSTLSRIRLLLSAGAPVPARVLRDAVKVMPNAEAHTPYGMTEVLPVADITLAGIEAAGAGRGVCVGVPAPSVAIAIDPLDDSGVPGGTPGTTPDVVGEICIKAPHMRDSYDKLWVTTEAAATADGWHRSGDVGHLDDEGRLWVEGRIAHLITTNSGPVTPVAVEHAAASVPSVRLAAAVGVGPRGRQVLIVVVELDPPERRAGLASLSVADKVRATVSHDVAAVLTVPKLPVDKRHNSKINRHRVAAWAEGVLAGGRPGRL